MDKVDKIIAKVWKELNNPKKKKLSEMPYNREWRYNPLDAVPDENPRYNIASQETHQGQAIPQVQATTEGTLTTAGNTVYTGISATSPFFNSSED